MRHLEYEICFRGLQNYTTLKLGATKTLQAKSFRGLQNYTTLKLSVDLTKLQQGFRGLQNYTTLKPYRV